MNLRAMAVLAIAVFVIAATPASASLAGRNGRIVFTRVPGDRFGDLYSINQKGSGLDRLTETRGAEDGAAVGPNGRRIAFTKGADTFDTDIAVMSISGRRMRRIVKMSGGNDGAHWSPDGSRIVFHNIRNRREGEIYSVRPNGSDRRRLTSDGHDDLSPVWSPDGDRIAFFSTRGSGDFDIWTMSASGGDFRRVTTDATVCKSGCGDRYGGLSGLDYSPDGDRIVFSANKGDGASNIWIVDEDGTDLHRLTGGSEPSWSPDGDWIAFSGGGNLHKIPADGGRRRKLTGSDEDSSPAWGPRR